jgi:hypothetical protein
MTVLAWEGPTGPPTLEEEVELTRTWRDLWNRGQSQDFQQDLILVLRLAWLNLMPHRSQVPSPTQGSVDEIWSFTSLVDVALIEKALADFLNRARREQEIEDWQMDSWVGWDGVEIEVVLKLWGKRQNLITLTWEGP